MRRIVYPAGALLIGMAVAHGLFTMLVYVSNLGLHERALDLKAAGYLVIPGEPVLSGLRSIWPAFCGALFFTLTTGAGLSFLGFSAAWVYRISGFRKGVMAAIIALWFALIFTLNANGLNYSATSSFVLIPAVAFFFCRRWMPTDRLPGDNLGRAVHIAVILAVAVAWVPRLDDNVFINIRDYLLLENPAGKAVNTFYYQYTLYPAELFKDLDQKLQKAACISGISDSALYGKIADRLTGYEYLAIGNGSPCDLTVNQDGDQLLFYGPDQRLTRAGINDFFSDPGTVLRQVSEKADLNSIFRLFTFISLITAFPLSLYVFAHALFGLASGVFIRPILYRSVLASLICLAIGLGSVIPLYAVASGPMDTADIRKNLSSGDWRQQRVALKEICNRGIDPLRYSEMDREWMQSPHVPVRYWLVQSLGNSRSPDAFRMLLSALDDPHPNVACMAYHGLGRGRFPGAADVILSRLPEIRHWYVQWYAYKSLKRLGWRQTRSNTALGR